MSAFEGVLRKDQLGGQDAWILDCGRQTYTLRGRVPAELEGSRVRVTGRESPAFGIAMAGPVVDVQRVERA